MKKIVSVVIALLGIVSVCQAQNWGKVSKAIRKLQMQNIRQYSGRPYYPLMVKELKAYDSYRQRIDVPGLLGVDVKGDTLYIY